MKVIQKILFIGILCSLLLGSSSLIITAITANNNKKTIVKKTRKNYNYSKIINNKNSFQLIQNLNYVKEYISTSIILKQKTLEVSLIGGTAKENGITSKKYKESNLSWFNKKSKIGINRYRNQAIATINNSSKNLEDEDRIISKIIPIIKNHFYTYEFYLNKDNLIIPNINFFTDYNILLSSNNLNPVMSNISNDEYNINDTNPNFNGIALYSEEQSVSTKKLSLIGSSILRVAFEQVNFKAKIITFNNESNRFQYAKPTSIDNTTKSKKNNLQTNNLVKSHNIEISINKTHKHSNYLYFNKSREVISHSYSLFDKIPSNIIIPNNGYIPNSFDTHIGVVAIPTVKYTKLIDYLNNKYLYTVGAVLPIVTLISVITLITKIVWILNIKTRNKWIFDKLVKKISKRINDLDLEMTNLELINNINSIRSNIDAIANITDFYKLSPKTRHIIINDYITALRRRLLEKENWLHDNISAIQMQHYADYIRELRRIESDYEQIDHIHDLPSLDFFQSEMEVKVKTLISTIDMLDISENQKKLVQNYSSETVSKGFIKKNYATYRIKNQDYYIEQNFQDVERQLNEVELKLPLYNSLSTKEDVLTLRTELDRKLLKIRLENKGTVLMDGDKKKLLLMAQNIQRNIYRTANDKIEELSRENKTDEDIVITDTNEPTELNNNTSINNDLIGESYSPRLQEHQPYDEIPELSKLLYDGTGLTKNPTVTIHEHIKTYDNLKKEFLNLQKSEGVGNMDRLASINAEMNSIKIKLIVAKQNLGSKIDDIDLMTRIDKVLELV